MSYKKSTPSLDKAHLHWQQHDKEYPRHAAVFHLKDQIQSFLLPQKENDKKDVLNALRNEKSVAERMYDIATVYKLAQSDSLTLRHFLRPARIVMTDFNTAKNSVCRLKDEHDPFLKSLHVWQRRNTFLLQGEFFKNGEMLGCIFKQMHRGDYEENQIIYPPAKGHIVDGKLNAFFKEKRINNFFLPDNERIVIAPAAYY